MLGCCSNDLHMIVESFDLCSARNNTVPCGNAEATIFMRSMRHPSQMTFSGAGVLTVHITSALVHSGRHSTSSWLRSGRNTSSSSSMMTGARMRGRCLVLQTTLSYCCGCMCTTVALKHCSTITTYLALLMTLSRRSVKSVIVKPSLAPHRRPYQRQTVHRLR